MGLQTANRVRHWLRGLAQPCCLYSSHCHCHCHCHLQVQRRKRCETGQRVANRRPRCHRPQERLRRCQLTQLLPRLQPALQMAAQPRAQPGSKLVVQWKQLSPLQEPQVQLQTPALKPAARAPPLKPHPMVPMRQMQLQKRSAIHLPRLMPALPARLPLRSLRQPHGQLAPWLASAFAGLLQAGLH